MSATTSTAPAIVLPSNDRLAAYGIAALRIGQGLLFIAHGSIKLFVFTPAGTAAYFVSLGLPVFLAYLTIVAELIGGLALTLGFYGRIVALGFVPLMLGTIITAHGAKGFLFSSPGGGWEFPAFWTLALVVQALLGEGALSLRHRRSAQ